ncbi:MAG: hypothetical protein Q9228_001396 [Teloschistes exilis]
MLSERQATSNKLHSLAWVAALFTDGMPSSSPAFPRSRKILRVTEARPDRAVVKLPQPTHRPVLRGFSLVLYSAGRRRLRDSIMLPEWQHALGRGVYKFLFRSVMVPREF